MKKTFGLSIGASLALLAAACQPCAKCPTGPVAGSTAPAGSCAVNTGAPNMSATVDGQKLTLADISPEALSEVKKLEKEHQEKLHQLQTAALMDAVENRLKENEAKRRGISMEDLNRIEIFDKIQPASDEEVVALYNASGAAEQGYELEKIKGQIQMYLTQEQMGKLNEALVNSLKAKAKISYDIPVLPVEKEDLKLGDISVWGDVSKAKVVVVEFSDFECPYCSRGAKLVDEAVKGYGPEVIRVFKHFPLPFHQNAKKAAVAAVCAQKQGKFWPMHDILFDNQRELAADRLAGYAKQAGLDEAQFNDCMSDAAASQLVEADFAKGEEVGVQGTPTIYVNGMLMNAQSPDELRSYIESELKAAK